jgi:hypothetical protein
MKRCFASVLAILLLCLNFAALAEKQEEHHMGDWHSRGDGFHSANCTICGYPMRVPCTDFAAAFGGETLSFCPVCGRNSGENGTQVRCKVLLFDYTHSPLGDALVMQFEKPFGEEANVPCAFSVIFEYAGEVSEFDGVIGVSFKADLPSEFTLLRADGEELTETEYSYEDGLLSFNVTGGHGLYLIQAD